MEEKPDKKAAEEARAELYRQLGKAEYLPEKDLESIAKRLQLLEGK